MSIPISYPKVFTSEQSYKLTEVANIKRYFETEMESRRKIASKYRKWCSGFNWANNSGSLLAVIGGAGTTGLLLTSFLPPLALAIEGSSIVLGIGFFTAGCINRRLIKKLEKHDEIFMLSASKLNTIHDLVSKALLDGQIDDNEFRLILNEKEKYLQLKNSIRKQMMNKSNGDKENNEMFENFKKEYFERLKNLENSKLLK